MFHNLLALLKMLWFLSTMSMASFELCWFGNFEHFTITTIPLIMCVCGRFGLAGEGVGCFLVLGSYPIWAIINIGSNAN